MPKIVIDENTRFAFTFEGDFNPWWFSEIIEESYDGIYPWLEVQDLNGYNTYINLNNVKTIKVGWIKWMKK